MREIQAIRQQILNGRNYWDLPQDELEQLWATLGRNQWGFGAWEGREIIEGENYHYYVKGSKNKGDAGAKASMRRLVQQEKKVAPPARGTRAAFLKHHHDACRDNWHAYNIRMGSGNMGSCNRSSQMREEVEKALKSGQAYGTSVHGNTMWYKTSTFYVSDDRGELMEKGMSSKEAKHYMKTHKYNPVMDARISKLK
jgi:hypothetical protein